MPQAAPQIATPAHFSGFPPETFEFYAALAQAQDKAWFEAHRADYMAHVIEPAQAFIEALGDRLQTERSAVGYSPNHTGRGSFKKIHTDQRFNKGRDPFKTYAQMIFWEGPLKTKKENSCFIVTLAPGKVSLGAGLKYMESATLKEYRRQAGDERRGGQLRAAVEGARSAGCHVGDAHYKRVPRGFDPAHVNADLLRHNALYAWAEAAPPPDVVHGPGFVDWCVDGFEAMNPVHDWCVDVLQAVAKGG